MSSGLCINRPSRSMLRSAKCEKSEQSLPRWYFPILFDIVLHSPYQRSGILAKCPVMIMLWQWHTSSSYVPPHKLSVYYTMLVFSVCSLSGKRMICQCFRKPVESSLSFMLGLLALKLEPLQKTTNPFRTLKCDSRDHCQHLIYLRLMNFPASRLKDSHY
jgi:hypothetical protein